MNATARSGVRLRSRAPTIRDVSAPAPKSFASGTPADPRWLAVCNRDDAAVFFYAVRTTGIYCRPSCRARLPRPENVSFFTTTKDAEKAGFRACKRCEPALPPKEERTAREVAALCRFVEESETIPTLEALAKRMGLSPFHTHRLFKAATGSTPRAYARAVRRERMRAELSSGRSVTEALYRAGYGSSSRFYEDAQVRLGMTPRAPIAGGPAMRLQFGVGTCSLGHVLVAATERGLCAVLLGDAPDSLVADLGRRFPRARLVEGGASFHALLADVVRRVEDPRMSAALPLDIQGTLFQQRVWGVLLTIPPGEVWTYAALATAVGAPTAVRAVARACAANPLAVAVPCHRVVRSDGSLSGYRWGVERKRALLGREAKEAPTADSSVSPPATRSRRAREARPARRK